ncbi:transposase [Arenimonas sp.]|uniref:transposase n=1 Tax=Arenimonas sp. TaxID=1872635 RepID=UPI0039E3FB98
MTTLPTLAPLAGLATALRSNAAPAPQVSLLTFETHLRRPVFADFALACAAARAISDPCHWGESRLLAWVLLPDHWQGLVETRDEAARSRLVQNLKSSTTRSVRDWDASIEPLWARATQERRLRRDDDRAEAARYLVLEPVRCGLTATLDDYTFWNSEWV